MTPLSNIGIARIARSMVWCIENLAAWAQVGVMMLSLIAAIAAVAVSVYIHKQSTSPEVCARLTTDDDRDMVFFVVENIGRGTAYNISLRFNRQLPLLEEDVRDVYSGFVGRGIPMLTPGDKRSTQLCMIDEFHKIMGNGTILADVYFFDAYERAGKDPIHRSYVLDAYSFVGYQVESQEREMVDAVESIASSAQSLAQSVKNISGR